VAYHTFFEYRAELRAVEPVDTAVPSIARFVPVQVKTSVLKLREAPQRQVRPRKKSSEGQQTQPIARPSTNSDKTAATFTSSVLRPYSPVSTESSAFFSPSPLPSPVAEATPVCPKSKIRRGFKSSAVKSIQKPVSKDVHLPHLLVEAVQEIDVESQVRRKTCSIQYLYGYLATRYYDTEDATTAPKDESC